MLESRQDNLLARLFNLAREKDLVQNCINLYPLDQHHMPKASHTATARDTGVLAPTASKPPTHTTHVPCRN